MWHVLLRIYNMLGSHIVLFKSSYLISFEIIYYIINSPKYAKYWHQNLYTKRSWKVLVVLTYERCIILSFKPNFNSWNFVIEKFTRWIPKVRMRTSVCPDTLGSTRYRGLSADTFRYIRQCFNSVPYMELLSNINFICVRAICEADAEI